MSGKEPHYDPVCRCDDREMEHGKNGCHVTGCPCTRYVFHHVEEHPRS